MVPTKNIFKNKLRRFIAKHFYEIVKLIYFIKFSFYNFKNKSPIIILTPGKVGSSSVYKTLKKHTNKKVFHIHNISTEGINRSSLEHLNSDRKSLPLHLIVSNFLNLKFKSKKIKKQYVICIVREPISREISKFFQNTEFYKKTLEDNNLNIDYDMSIDILKNIFQKKKICEDIQQWFNDEIKNQFDIDVFDEPFDNLKKYKIFKKNNTSLLLFRMEDMNFIFSNATKDFFDGTIEIELIHANEGHNKHYAKVYKSVNENLVINENDLNRIVSSKYFKHFYNDKESSIYNKWNTNLVE
jgi:hypothetical protein